VYDLQAGLRNRASMEQYSLKPVQP
ncbi:uncharacterized protein METZ01_LOCUS257378, partial [marine metagenome]